MNRHALSACSMLVKNKTDPRVHVCGVFVTYLTWKKIFYTVHLPAIFFSRFFQISKEFYNIVIGGKCLHISRSMQINPVLFKSQL